MNIIFDEGLLKLLLICHNNMSILRYYEMDLLFITEMKEEFLALCNWEFKRH